MFNVKFPWSNDNMINLDWILEQIKKLHSDWSEFKVLNSIRFYGNWDITKGYPAWALVSSDNIGYISTQIVPAGVDITNEDYWKPVADYSALLADMQERISFIEKTISNLDNTYHSLSTYKNEHQITSDTIALNNMLDAGLNVLIDNDVILDADVIIDAHICGIHGGIIDLNDHKILFQGNANTRHNIVSVNSNKIITINDASSFNVGDTILISSNEFGWLKTAAIISSISDNNITLTCTYPITSLFGYIQKLDNYDITIDNCTFNNGTINLDNYIKGAILTDCTLNKTTIIVNGTKINILDNTFNTESFLSLYLASYCKLYSNTFINTYGIRLVGACNNEIKNNNVEGQYNINYGYSIDIEGCELSDFNPLDSKNHSSIYNLIIGNIIHASGFGVAGSGKAGIHFNGNPRYNTISDNIISDCENGIYFENGGSFNTIDNNKCSYNSGYYGNGIQLDWDCVGNVISNNTCNNNYSRGDEGYGIEMRGGLTDDNHACHDNIICGNICYSNAHGGISISGYNNKIVDNKCYNNRVRPTLANVSEIIINAINCIISNNICNTDDGQCILITNNSSHIIITSNNLKTGVSTCVLNYGNKVEINSNMIISSLGAITCGACSNVLISNNYINGSIYFRDVNLFKVLYNYNDEALVTPTLSGTCVEYE